MDIFKLQQLQLHNAYLNLANLLYGSSVGFIVAIGIFEQNVFCLLVLPAFIIFIGDTKEGAEKDQTDLFIKPMMRAYNSRVPYPLVNTLFSYLSNYRDFMLLLGMLLGIITAIPFSPYPILVNITAMLLLSIYAMRLVIKHSNDDIELWESVREEVVFCTMPW